VTDHDHEHDDHEPDGHDAPGQPEDPRWVLIPLAAGFLAGIVVLLVLGIESGAVPFT
jgi:hypothetical protein